MIRFCAVATLALLASPVFAAEIPTRDHTVTVTSTVPAIAGQKSTLYVRERALPTVLRHGAGGKVVLFVHGAGAGSQNAIGTGVVGGMITATVLAIFFVPVFFVVVKRLFRQDRPPADAAPAPEAEA